LDDPLDEARMFRHQRARQRQDESIRSLQRDGSLLASLGGKEEDREPDHHHTQNEDTVEVHDRMLGLRNASPASR